MVGCKTLLCTQLYFGQHSACCQRWCQPSVAPTSQKRLNSISSLWVKDHPSYWQPGFVKNTCGWQVGSSRCQESRCRCPSDELYRGDTCHGTCTNMAAACLNENVMYNLHHKWLAAYCTCLVLYSCEGKWCNRCLTCRHLPIWAGVIRVVILLLFILSALWSVTSLHGYQHHVINICQLSFEEHECFFKVFDDILRLSFRKCDVQW